MGGSSFDLLSCMVLFPEVRRRELAGLEALPVVRCPPSLLHDRSMGVEVEKDNNAEKSNGVLKRRFREERVHGQLAGIVYMISFMNFPWHCVWGGWCYSILLFLACHTSSICSLSTQQIVRSRPLESRRDGFDRDIVASSIWSVGCWRIYFFPFLALDRVSEDPLGSSHRGCCIYIREKISFFPLSSVLCTANWGMVSLLHCKYFLLISSALAFMLGNYKWYSSSMYSELSFYASSNRLQALRTPYQNTSLIPLPYYVWHSCSPFHQRCIYWEYLFPCQAPWWWRKKFSDMAKKNDVTLMRCKSLGCGWSCRVPHAD